MCVCVCVCVCVCACVCVSAYVDACIINVDLKKNLFIYLFLATLCLPCWARAFSSCGEQRLLFVAVHGLLIAVASLVAEHGL